jgi:protein involved in polysaccharide export with SLBB domain
LKNNKLIILISGSFKLAFLKKLNSSFNRKAACILFWLAVLSSASFAQITPEYRERSILRSKDTTNNISNLYAASEGIINPEEYKVGPGDKFFISIRGIDEAQIYPVVSFEGVLYIPRMGAVDVNDITLKDAKKKIEKLILKNYKDVEIFISITEFRKIKVSLIGDVRFPENIIVSSNSRLMDLINMSEGLNPTANLRHIKIINLKGNSKYYDFLTYLRYGDLKQNPYLNVGDIVSVEKSDVTVSIGGRVKNPGNYEFLEGESAASLIELAGGFYDNAKTDTLELIRFEADNKTQKSYFYSYRELVDNNVKLYKRDRIIVREKPDYMIEKTVMVNGYVRYPGVYKIVENVTTLDELLAQTGGFKENASLRDATLTRSQGVDSFDPEFDRLKNVPRTEMTDDEYDYLKSKSRQRKGRVVVDFESLILKGNKSESVVLKTGDIINVPEAKNYIILLGQVVNPGNVTYKEGLTYKDYIELCGGYGWRAMKGDVRIIKANTGEWVDADEDVSLKPGDTIWIPEDPPGPKFWDVFTRTLTIVGQVATVVAATVAVIVATR